MLRIGIGVGGGPDDLIPRLEGWLRSAPDT